MKAPQRGSRLRLTGEKVLVEDPKDPNHLIPKDQMEEILPAGFPYFKVAQLLLAGLVVVLVFLGVVALWTMLTGGVIHLTVTYPAGAGHGHLIPTPAPIRTTTP